jgi:hypothetical protein
MKLVHVLGLGLAIVGLLYVGHMMMSHQGQKILPGIGVNA